MHNFIRPDWPAPSHIHACSTTRTVGNLASHTGDDHDAVASRRERLIHHLQLPNEPAWLSQQHTNIVIDAPSSPAVADGSYTVHAQTVCAVLTADCLPILLCNTQGTEIAALHAGWRSLSSGIIAQGIQKFHSAPTDLLAWLGPAISQRHFEVGPEVKHAFLEQNADAEAAFIASNLPNRLMADLYHLARLELQRLGVQQIYGGNYCTYADPDRFYSYRRDAKPDRFASLIWMQ